MSDIKVRVGQKNAVRVVSSASGSVGGFAVVSENVIGGIASVSSLYVSGLSTFVGLSTFRDDVYIGGDLIANRVSAGFGGPVSFDNISTKNLVVTNSSLFTGVSTFSSNIIAQDIISQDITAQDITAQEYYGSLVFGLPFGGFKPGAIAIGETDYTKNSINDINFVLGKLVPKPPITIKNASLSLNLSSSFLCGGFTPINNTNGVYSITAGTSYPRNTSNFVTSTWLTEYGPGDQGIVSGIINFTAEGTKEMTSNDVINPDNTITNDAINNNGTYGALQIANDKDAFFSSRNPGIASDFYEVYDARLINAPSPDGFNMAYIAHQVGVNTNESQRYLYYEDPSTVTSPVLTSSTPVTPPSPVVAYSSGVPHYTESANNAFQYVITCQNATGDMYSSLTFLSSSGQTSGFQNGGNKSYTDFAGGTNPPARNFGVGVGVTCFVAQIPRNLHTRVTTDTQKFSSYSASTPYGSGTIRATITQAVNIMGTTATTNAIDEDNILITTLGTGSGNATRVNAGATGDNPSPVFTSWSPSSEIASYEAAVVGGILSHNQTNYSTGNLPVGPNYSSGRTGAQYFQVQLIRSNVSEFLILVTGSYAGCWVCMPNNSAWTTSLSGVNGWANMFQAYRGSGIPTTALPGCAFAGNMTGGSGTFRCVFGTESSSNDSNNRILVRFRLNSGQSITALSFRNT